MGVVCPIKEAFVGGGWDHPEVSGQNKGKKFIPFVAGIFRALDATNGLHDETTIGILNFTERMIGKTEVEPSHIYCR